MYDEYSDAVKRSAMLETLMPKGWRAFVIGNSVAGYHLSISHEDEPMTTLRLNDDEHIKRLLALYVEQCELMAKGALSD